MTTAQPTVELVKSILDNIHDPKRLDLHPLTGCLFVKEAVKKNPYLQKESPGQQLIAALCELFPEMMPRTHPRRGKRLDNHWGEFGILAARYFVPLRFGTAVPNSLRDAWGRIDISILYCVYGKPIETLDDEQIKLYQLVGSDLDYACASTLSDWHKKGLQRLTEFVCNHEQSLSKGQITTSRSTDSQAANRTVIHRRVNRWLKLALLLLFLLVLGQGALKLSRIYQKGMLVYQELGQIQGILAAPTDLQNFELAMPTLTRVRGDLASLKEESWLLLTLAPTLNGLPVYGNDLALTPRMFELADHMLDAAIYTCQAAQPILDKLNAQDATLDPAALTELLVQAQPTLEQARQELDQAIVLRKGVDVEKLSPRFRGWMVDKIDPILNLTDDGLSLGMILPGIAGASNNGPQTYLLLIQNEDELRPTGGFITSTGNLVIYKGKIISLKFEAIDEQDDWSEPYPEAPWQLQEYMNSPVLILRDANWFTDFPTTVRWVESLYAYTHSHSVDGVIAFDQHFLVMLLDKIGPIDVEGVDYPITSANVIEYMREAKKPPDGESIPANWTRKDFIGKIAAVLLTKLYNGKQDWPTIVGVLTDALAERHLLLQFDDPIATSLLAKRGWDNAVRSGSGDFLMVTDTNIGFNKTNAVVDVSLNYDVDLRNPDSPVGTLTLIHKNNAKRNVPCVQWDRRLISGDEWYPIDRCYWSYERIYKQAGIQLLSATPHAIPGDWLILGEDIPAQVDMLEEDIPGITGFGSLLVVLGGGTVQTTFQFDLPQEVLSFQPTTKEFTYHLKVQKQPGTLAHALTIQVHLPQQMELILAPDGAITQNNSLILAKILRTDVELDVVFGLP
jgi:hypothetical protein